MIIIKQSILIETIKLLLYKESPSIFEQINFEDNNAFLEPLLFTFFNYKKEQNWTKELLLEVMQGYLINKQSPKINFSYCSNQITYIPILGYFKKGESKPFDLIKIIEGTTIEILKHPIYLHNNIFRNKLDIPICKEKITINKSLIKKNISFLTNAFHLIKKYSEEHFFMIEKSCKKIVIFKTDINNTNSFATIKVHGIAFINVYQDDYDEVFFVDDIAHQTGHIILTTLFIDKEAIFKIDEEQNVEDIIRQKDHRNVHTLIHALYTYYTTLLCLDNCLKNNAFTKNQKREAIARIGFYLNKCTIDLDRFNQINEFFGGIENVLALDGMKIYLFIEENLLSFSKKWFHITNKLNYSNQPYNFTLKDFNKLNN